MHTKSILITAVIIVAVLFVLAKVKDNAGKSLLSKIIS